MKKSEEKKISDLGFKFYVEVAKRSNTIEAFGLDRKKVGKFLCKLANKYVGKINPTDQHCLLIEAKAEEIGLLSATADKIIVVQNWEEKLKKMFPVKKEKSGTLEKVTLGQIVRKEETQQVVINNNYEFYLTILERMGSDFMSQKALKALISSLNKGGGKQFVYNKIAFLQKQGLIESIEDEGVVKHLRAQNYVEILESKKPGLLKNKPQKQQQQVIKRDQEIICICINTNDLGKLNDPAIIFNDGHKCVTEIKVTSVNLEVVKNITTIEIDQDSQNTLAKHLASQREFYLKELSKIERLCGEKKA